MTARTPWDVVVVGGGPVGLCASLHAARLGLRVVVLEPRATPIDKACGEGLMPSALRELAQLGIDPVGRPFVGIRYLTADGRHQAAASFAAGPGRGVRRTELQRSCDAQVRAAGVQVVADRVVDVGWDCERAAVVTANGRRFASRYIVAADGLHSLVRRRSGLARDPAGATRRFGLRQHVGVVPWDDHVQVHWTDDVEAYVTPVGERCVGVAFLTSRREPWPVLLEHFPELHRRLAAHDAATDARGAGPLRQNVDSPQRGRVLLVGDAAGYVDALTGEGLAVGLVSARLAVQAIADGAVSRYPGQWRRATARSRVMTEITLRAATTPWIRRQLVPQAAAHPALFASAVRALA